MASSTPKLRGGSKEKIVNSFRKEHTIITTHTPGNLVCILYCSSIKVPSAICTVPQKNPKKHASPPSLSTLRWSYFSPRATLTQVPLVQVQVPNFLSFGNLWYFSWFPKSANPAIITLKAKFGYCESFTASDHKIKTSQELRKLPY